MTRRCMVRKSLDLDRQGATQASLPPMLNPKPLAKQRHQSTTNALLATIMAFRRALLRYGLKQLALHFTTRAHPCGTV